MTSTLKELTTTEMAQIIYTSWLELEKVTDPVTPWQPFDSLNNELKALEVAQVERIIKNIRLRPHELHQYFKVTGQKLIADGALDENIIARLNIYMIPFGGLGIVQKTRFRLQVQLTRILMRHNRNVTREEKRPG